MSYPGRGVVYNVVAKFQDYESSYVPVATYNCDFADAIDGCGKLSGTTGKLVVIFLGLIGVLIALRGHQWFKTQMFFFGFIGAALPTFVLLAKFTACQTRGKSF